MAVDFDLIRFTGGPFKGRAGVSADRKLQVFILYGPEGQVLTTWAIYDVYADEEKQKDKNYVPEGTFKILQENPFKTMDDNVFRAEDLALVARVGIELQEKVGQVSLCLGENISKAHSRKIREREEAAKRSANLGDENNLPWPT